MGPDDAEREAIQPYRPGAAPIRAEAAASDAAPVELNIAKERLTTFFGQELREPRPWPILAILMTLASAAGFAFGAAFSSLEVVLAAGVAPLLAALVLWWTRPPAVGVRFSEDGILFQPANYQLPYERINRVFAPQAGTRRRFRILLLCDRGHITLHPKLTADAGELYRFLRSQPLGVQTIPDEIDPAFNAFLRQQLTLHGAEQLTIYQARQWHQKQLLRNSWRFNDPLRAALAFFVGGVFVLTAFFLMNPPSRPGLAVPGMLAVLLSLILVVAGLLAKAKHRVPKKFRNATLIISPTGLALSQAELKGELRWNEITKVSGGRPTGFVMSSAEMVPGVWLHVLGATIFLADTYQWPAEHIEWLIRKHAGL